MSREVRLAVLVFALLTLPVADCAMSLLRLGLLSGVLKVR